MACYLVLFISAVDMAAKLNNKVKCNKDPDDKIQMAPQKHLIFE